MREQTSWKAESVWAAFVCLLCGHFALAFGQRSLPFLKYDHYLAGTEVLPFQGRVLMAWVMRALLHGGVAQSVVQHSHRFMRDSYEVATIIINFVALWVAVGATRISIRHLTGSSVFARWSCLLIVWMSYFNLVMPYGLTYSLPYDVPSLAFFAVGVMLVVVEQSYWLVPLVAVATFNRETICFVIAFYAVWEWWRLRDLAATRRILRIAPLFCIQAVIWVAIKLWLRHHFLNNPVDVSGNGYFEGKFLQNLHYLANPMQWPLMFSVCGFLWIFVLLQHRWLTHGGLRLVFKAVIPLWVLAMMLVGIIVEIRVFNELSALLTLAVAWIVFTRYQTDASRSAAMPSNI